MKYLLLLVSLIGFGVFFCIYKDNNSRITNAINDNDAQVALLVKQGSLGRSARFSDDHIISKYVLDNKQEVKNTYHSNRKVFNACLMHIKLKKVEIDYYQPEIVVSSIYRCSEQTFTGELRVSRFLNTQREYDTDYSVAMFNQELNIPIGKATQYPEM